MCIRDSLYIGLSSFKLQRHHALFDTTQNNHRKFQPFRAVKRHQCHAVSHIRPAAAPLQVAFLTKGQTFQHFPHGFVEYRCLTQLLHSPVFCKSHILLPFGQYILGTPTPTQLFILFCHGFIHTLRDTVLIQIPQKPKALPPGQSVPFIQDTSEKRHGSLYLGFHKKLLPARHHIWDPLFFQAFFQKLRLPMGAVKNCDILKASGRPIIRTGKSLLGIQHINPSYQSVYLLCRKDRLRHLS